VLLDATHSAGVLPIEMARRGIDLVVAAGYKHLLCPRGVGLLAISARMQERIVPLCASWRAQADPYSDYFGGGLDKLAPDGSRFDVSLAWFSWVGARASLSLLDGVPAHERERWCVGLADALADALQLRPTGSSILSVPVRGDRTTVAAALDAAKLRVSHGQDAVRVSFHLYNGPNDVDRAATVLASLRDPARCE
jgi:selenocysteine lyase/cysteine desulfurase